MIWIYAVEGKDFVAIDVFQANTVKDIAVINGFGLICFILVKKN